MKQCGKNRTVPFSAWFDEFSLKLGDSLRESIEKGIKETDFCILIITRNFLTNDGWTKAEFNSVFTKEIIEKKKVMLPIWHDVSKEEVYEYSPSLVDRLAAKWSEGVDSIAAKLRNRIDWLTSHFSRSLAAPAEFRVGWEELNDIEIETSLWYWNNHEKG